MRLVFERYISTNQHGSGLGLAMVDYIVKQHRAAIFVTNNELGGATFLLLMDPKNKDGVAKFPEFFDPHHAPAERLNDIQAQILAVNGNSAD